MNLNTYVTWDELTKYIFDNTGLVYNNINVHSEHKGLSVDGKLPYSISEYEFNFIKDFIIAHNFKKGFELATGACLSTIAIGHALKQNGGFLLSVDSYEEYDKQYIPTGTGHVASNSTLFSSNNKLIDLFSLYNVILKIGTSPNDTDKYIQQYFNKNIDFVFLDCPKTVEDFIRDIIPIQSQLNDKFAIFVHDTFAYPIDRFNDVVYDIFKIRPVQITNYYSKYTSRFPLSLITNIHD